MSEILISAILVIFGPFFLTQKMDKIKNPDSFAAEWVKSKNSKFKISGF